MKSFQKIKRIDKPYTKWILKQPCVNPKCMYNAETTRHHARILGNGGMGLKPPDKDQLPLCKICHHDLHQKGEITFWGLSNKSETKLFVQKLCDELIKRYK